jgi:hypothetical protein
MRLPAVKVDTGENKEDGYEYSHRRLVPAFAREEQEQARYRLTASFDEKMTPSMIMAAFVSWMAAPYVPHQMPGRYRTIGSGLGLNSPKRHLPVMSKGRGGGMVIGR